MPKPSKTTIEKQEKVKRMSPEDRMKIEKIMTEFISKYRKKCINIARQRFTRVFHSVPEEYIEDYVQDIFLYMYINYETTFSFYETGYMFRLFNSIVYSPTMIRNMAVDLKRADHEEIIEEIVFEEDEEQWSPGGLDPHMSYEERKYLHELALEETKQYLKDNPESKLHTALKLAKEKSDNNYLVGLHYIATPSYTWLCLCGKEYGLKNQQHAVSYFKQCLEQAYGKTAKKNAISHYRYRNK